MAEVVVEGAGVEEFPSYPKVQLYCNEVTEVVLMSYLTNNLQS